jgi:phosphoribosylaminoimidazole (AIR) synthetase
MKSKRTPEEIAAINAQWAKALQMLREAAAIHRATGNTLGADIIADCISDLISHGCDTYE